MLRHYNDIFSLVPPPMVTILPSISTVYAGSLLTINCSFELNNAVDSPFTVATVWRKNGVEFTTLSHRTVLETVLIANSLYQAQVVFDPVQLSTDDGQYSCEVIVNADVEFVIEASIVSNTILLSATGNHDYTQNPSWS